MNVIFIRDKIYEIRGQRVMLDFVLAALYEVPTKVLNQAVKRNAERFPEDFMFRLTEEEWMRSQFVTSSAKGAINIQTYGNQDGVNRQNGIQIISNPPQPPNWSHFVTSSTPSQPLNSSQSVMSSKNRGKSYLPYAFTEHGVTMLASVLRSENAVKMSIEVVRAFIALKQFAIEQNNRDTRLQQIEDRIGEHDVQLNSIYDAIENLLDEKAAQRHWVERERIGFKNRKQ
ncbi:MAG TPA: ORF6N domain-containing protein [Puia sp.]|nr:ORF6N domain-containing protein [Puia sp.]